MVVRVGHCGGFAVAVRRRPEGVRPLDPDLSRDLADRVHSHAGQRRGEWERRSSFALPKAVEFLPDRVYVVDAVSRAEHLWPAFHQVIETAAAFAFMIDGVPVIVLPKRALGSAEALRAFRSMLLSAMPGRVTFA